LLISGRRLGNTAKASNVEETASAVALYGAGGPRNRTGFLFHPIAYTTRTPESLELPPFAWLHQNHHSLSYPCYECDALNSAALERLPVPDAILRDVAAGALGIAALGGWHSADFANL
jgi:hypothetical protein